MLKRNILVLSAAALLAISMAAHANEVEVRGSRSCGTWIQDRQDRRTGEASADEAWLVGYLSGIALAGSHGDFLVAIDNASLFLWVDNYCRANPLKSTGTAGKTLAHELSQNRDR